MMTNCVRVGLGPGGDDGRPILRQEPLVYECRNQLKQRSYK